MIDKKKILFCLLGLFISGCSAGDTHQSKLAINQYRFGSSNIIENFALLDHEGKHHELYYYSDMKAIVLISQGNGSPILRQSIPYIEELKREYESKGVKFFMINANPQDDRSAIMKEATEYGISVPILEDSSQLVTRALNMTKTAEVIVVDPNGWEIIYYGAMNDRVGYENEKKEISHNFLKDAIDAILNDGDLEVKRTAVKGSSIQYEVNDNISYVDDVAPVLINKCLPCHSPGGPAPFSMKNYQKIRGWAPMIREVVRTKRMPPWSPDPYIGKFKFDGSLSPDEVRTLVHWVESGFKRGYGKDPLLLASKPHHQRWLLGEPDLRIYCADEERVPAAGVLPYRFCESVNGFEEDTWVRAIDLRPRNLKVVHHMQAFHKPLGAVYKGHFHPDHSFKGKRGGNYFAGYLPGKRPYVLEDGVGKLFKKGSKVIFEMHYVPIGRAETDKMELGLYLLDEKPEKELLNRFITDRDFMVPANTTNFKMTDYHVFDEEVVLYALRPHMHLRGKSAKFIAQYADGSEEVLLSVPKYNFYWQHQYVFEEPKILPAGTKLILEGIFDNSFQNPNDISFVPAGKIFGSSKTY